MAEEKNFENRVKQWLNIMVAEVQERAFPICLYVRMVDLSVLKLKLNTVSWHRCNAVI